MGYAKNAWARTAQLASYAALALGLSSASLTASAGSSEMKLTVTASVLKHASLQVLSQPSAVVVTAADIARGYVDVAAPAQVAVKNNSGGYMLMFSSNGDFMRQILVRGLGTDVQLSPEGGVVTQTSSGRGMTRNTLDLGFRFVLSEAAHEGTYAWPMQMSVTPL